MKAFVYRGPWRAAIEEWPEPGIARDEDVLVAIRATGICGTDVGIVAGHYVASAPVVLGHETAGVVVAVGAQVEDFVPGDRVVVDPTYFCGRCRYCATGRPNHCVHKPGTETGVSADGAFAPLYRTEARFLRKLKPSTPFRLAILTEPTSCALTGLKQVGALDGRRALVFGCGPMGLIYASLLDHRGAGGVLVDGSAHRRAVAEAIFGRRWTVVADGEAAVDAIRRSHGAVDVAVEASGVGLSHLLEVIDRGGKIVLVALRSRPVEIVPSALTDRSVSLIGSIDTIGTFDEALEAVETGVVPASTIVDATVPFKEIEEGFRLVGCDIGDGRLNGEIRAAKVAVEITT
ncbi:alcohol dehydrogenase catalytic domain-containing protein [Chelatococcus sp. SYSU_G07232]|uniref:Alcohol dehydrogenase catalytic domain-containing protein n=1 Tax=Chelatococcus albus TaxID=3047466 RepID=A0ABT7AGW7_9HYPH|nr:alcohol dehydrogenase catalytic domain-containing protein [Chelatococcus sp. SYSU_G07232]MDJ1158079.1 alcohol dehydrogenase catalytic domain-containing protein [Chelatococcus sp. SYSU_G07232]